MGNKVSTHVLMLKCAALGPSMKSRRSIAYAYKAIHGYAPLYISDLIRTRERTNYNLRSSSQLLLQPYNATKTKKTLGDRAFQVASPALWNGLPNDIRNAKTMDVFKSLVKTHLFRKAYACYFF